MPRPPRQDPVGGWHHVTNRKAGSGYLFRTDDDYFLFLRLMAFASVKFEINIAAYCLMGNHFHIVAHCPNAKLSEFMHHVEGNYARTFNIRHGRHGSLYDGRYGNRLITTDGQLEVTTRYVHRNPLELGFDITNYPWSSYPTYCGRDLPSCRLVDLSTWMTLQLAGGLRAYRDFVETDFHNDKLNMAMATKVRQTAPPVHPETALSQLGKILAVLSGDDVHSSQRGTLNRGRHAAVLIAAESGLGFADEMTNYFGYTSAATYHHAVHKARKMCGNDAAFASLVLAARDAWLATNQANVI